MELLCDGCAEPLTIKKAQVAHGLLRFCAVCYRQFNRERNNGT